jgi:hypothetical protein
VAAPVYVGGIHLPTDDSIVLDASDDGPLVVDRVGPVWQTLNDLLQLLPAVLRSGSSALRDTWLQVWGQAVLIGQSRVGYVLEAQASPRFADGLWLDAWGRLLGKPRISDEADCDYRARLLTGVDLLTPKAIKAAVSNIVGLTPVVYNEPAVDQAFCGPATTSDPPSQNASKQTIGSLQTWFAFTQPQIPLSGAATQNQSVYYGQNLRFFANYSGATGNKSVGAYSAPLGAGFWIIVQAPVGDDSLTPHSEPESFSTSNGSSTIGLDPQDFTYQPFQNDGFGGLLLFRTQNQSVIQPQAVAPMHPTWGYVPAAYDTVVDRFNIEISRRKAAGVPWVVMIDYPLQFVR